MANYTENLKLELPSGNEFYNIEKFNENFTKIDGVVSNPNLLDNPWFTVNQRNATTLTDGMCFVDRWMGVNHPSGTVNSDSTLTLNSQAIAQRVEKGKMNIGETYTASVMLGNGKVYYGTFTPTDNEWKVVELYDSDGNKLDGMSVSYCVYSHPDFDDFAIGSDGTSFVIKALKLERGSVSTLANDHAPDYATELLKCQRYYYTAEMWDVGYASSTSYVYAKITLPTQMRALPIATISGDGTVAGNGAQRSITSISTTAVLGNKILLYFGTAGSLSLLQVYVARGVHIHLSADL